MVLQVQVSGTKTTDGTEQTLGTSTYVGVHVVVRVIRRCVRMRVRVCTDLCTCVRT